MTTKLRGLLAAPGVIVGPCAYDCVSVKLIEQAGFPAAFHGNFNAAANLLGVPDVGLITRTESVTLARHMAEAVEIPVICDVDDGYGDVVNVARTTSQVIRAGLAGMYIEDQVTPKRCPSLGGGEVISMEAMLRRLRVVDSVRAEEDPDFVVVVRTHASLAVSMDDAVRRGIEYARAGGDVIFVDLGYSDAVYEQLPTIAEKIAPHAHLVANMTENVGRPMLTSDELYDMGFKIVTYPLTLLMTAAAAMRDVLKELMDRGTTRALADRMMKISHVGELMGMDKVRELEKIAGPEGAPPC